MGGLRGQIREPRADARARRNSQRIADSAQFLSGSDITVDDDGILTITKDPNGGLTTTANGLAVNLIAQPGLVLSASGLAALVQGVLAIDGSGIYLSIGDGLENDGSGNLRVKLDGTTLQRNASGISVITANLAAAATATRGVVNQAAARADSGQSTVTLSAVTDPVDTPADADALRDDLVANTLPSLATRDTELETAIETLAGEFNDLLAKLRTAGVLDT